MPATAPSLPPSPVGLLPQASPGETAAVAASVLLPLVARGLIVRRPRIVALAERLDVDRRALRRLQRLRARHGTGPVLLRLPGRTIALVLRGDDLRRVLEGAPEPFATANLEKRFALAHFEPRGVLISDAPERGVRRPFNEAVLQPQHPLHPFASAFAAIVRQEAGLLAAAALRAGVLDWPQLSSAWWRVVRRVVLGDGAREDSEVTDLLTALRRDANWSYLRPRRRRLRRRFFARLEQHLQRAEPGSLAALVTTVPAPPGTEPTQQVPQWLFAFEAAGMACMRTLALLAAYPAQAQRVRDQVALQADAGAGSPAAQPTATDPGELPLLRAAVLESLRLWPTTPALLRDSTAVTRWADGRLPAGAAVLIFAPLFHRDERLPFADRFAPDEVWLDGDGRLDDHAEGRWPLVPFSGGPAACPGRNLVLLTTSTMLAALLSRLHVRLDPPGRLDPAGPLPSVLSPFDLRFAVTAAAR